MAKNIRDKAKSYAYRLLNYRPRTELEIRDKLRQRGFSEDIVDNLVLQLKEKSLVDDYNFARMWAKYRMHGNNHGFFKIRQELLEKGIDKNTVEDIEQLLKKDFNEYDTAKQLISSRLKSMCGLDKDKAQRRLYSYLKSRGFSGSTIYKVINEAYADTQ
jgi:regulatory protein